LIAAAAAAPVAANGRPNVLLILTDDQRADGTMDVMPKTRQWFEDGGTRFSQFFATTPLCCPARASIFSGRFTHNHGVRNNTQPTVFDERFTIQAYLKAAGYRNGFFGKYFNGWSPLRNPPWFDDWAVFSGYSPFGVNENGVVKVVTQYGTSYIRDNALRFIEQSESEDATPWFLELATSAPHAPSTPDAAYQNAAVPAFAPTPANSETDRRDKPPHVQNQTADMGASTDCARRASPTIPPSGSRCTCAGPDMSCPAPRTAGWPLTSTSRPPSRPRWAASPRRFRWTAVLCWTRCRAALGC
jgi:arylsulfatase A-like enzyme